MPSGVPPESPEAPGEQVGGLDGGAAVVGRKKAVGCVLELGRAGEMDGGERRSEELRGCR